jgi:hydroxymethylbilane synthase
MNKELVIGSRGSKLALVQAETIKAELLRLETSIAVRIEIIKTSGDVKTDPLSVIGGKGVFTKELEDALLDGRIDLAVHSLKDLPTILPEKLLIAAITKREDPRDALVLSKRLRLSAPSIAALPPGATLGTSSPRRLAQLRNLRTDLVINDLRGNIDTRVRKLDEGQYDALVLACAGLRRLGMADRISVAIPASELLPAVGQGALGVEVRADDEQTIAAVNKLDHKFTRLACTAERALLRSLGGGCQLPIAGYAIVREKRIRLDGLVADPQGRQLIRDRVSGSLEEAEELGATLGARLLDQGASTLLQHRESES